jgi:hypothetical protein
VKAIIALAVAVGISIVPAAIAQTPNSSAPRVRRAKTIEIPGARWTHQFDSDLTRIAILRETEQDYRTSVYSLTNAREICELSQPERYRFFGVAIQSMLFLDKENELLIVDSEGRFVFCDIKRQAVDRIVRLPWFVLNRKKIAEEFAKSKRSIRIRENLALEGLQTLTTHVLPDKKNMVVLYRDGTIVVLDLRTGQLRKTVRKGSYQSSVAEFGKNIDAQFATFSPQFFGTRLSKSSDWVVPKSIRIGKKPEWMSTLIRGCIGRDVIISDKKGIARLNIDSGKEKWRTNSGYHHSKLTSNLKLIAEIEKKAIRLYRTSDGKLEQRIPIEGLGKKDQLVDIKTDANGEVFLLRSNERQFLLVNRRGQTTRVRWDESKDGVVYRTGLSADGRRIAFLTSNETVEMFDIE